MSDDAQTQAHQDALGDEARKLGLSIFNTQQTQDFINLLDEKVNVEVTL